MKLNKRVKDNLPGAFTLTNKRGLQCSENKLRRIWDGVRIKAAIDVRLYDATRHSFGSQLANGGTSFSKLL